MMFLLVYKRVFEKIQEVEVIFFEKEESLEFGGKYFI